MNNPALVWRAEGSASAADAPLVLGLHGQGMDGNALARHLAPLFSLPLRFVLPTAPLWSADHRYNGPSWYDYDGDQERFLAELQRTERLLLDFLAAVEAERGWRPRARVLFGFSQGGYCGSYAALHHVDVFSGLVVSGARVKVEILAEPIQRAARRGFAVLVCHGERDRLVQADAARAGYETLVAAGVPATWRTFAGGHSLGGDQVRVIGEWLESHFSLG